VVQLEHGMIPTELTLLESEVNTPCGFVRKLGGFDRDSKSVGHRCAARDPGIMPIQAPGD
jgi:hypothetical protein